MHLTKVILICQRTQNEGEEIIETSHTGVETHVPENPEERRDTSKRMNKVDRIDTDEEPRQKIRRYRKWSECDTAKLLHILELLLMT